MRQFNVPVNREGEFFCFTLRCATNSQRFSYKNRTQMSCTIFSIAPTAAATSVPKTHFYKDATVSVFDWQWVFICNIHAFHRWTRKKTCVPPSPWTIQHSRCMTFKWTTSRICIDSHRSCIFILFFLRNFSLFTLSLSHIFLHSINNWQMIRYLRCFDVFHTVLQWWICTVFVLSKEPPLY